MDPWDEILYRVTYASVAILLSMAILLIIAGIIR